MGINEFRNHTTDKMPIIPITKIAKVNFSDSYELRILLKTFIDNFDENSMRDIVNMQYYHLFKASVIDFTAALVSKDFIEVRIHLYSFRVNLAIIYLSMQEGCSEAEYNQFPDLQEIGDAMHEFEKKL